MMEPIDMKTIYNNLNQMDIKNKGDLLMQLQFTEFSELPSMYDQIKFLQGNTLKLTVSQIQSLLGVSNRLFYDVSHNSSFTRSQIKGDPNIIRKNCSLTRGEEDLIIQQIKFNQEIMNCMTTKEVREFATELYFQRTNQKKDFDKHWWSRFLTRYYNDIATNIISTLENSRALLSRPQVEKYYDDLKNVFSLNIHPELLLNMDESGIESRPDKDTTIKCVTYRNCLIKPYKREFVDYRHITLVSTISLNGGILKSLIISPKQFFKKDIENETWYNDMHYCYSKSGYINQKVMLKWIDLCLVPYIASIRILIGDQSAPCVLIMDNMSAHVTHQVMEKFNTIINFFPIFLPPHSSHILQPLDLSFFGILKSKYRSLRYNHPVKTIKDKIHNLHHALYDASYIDNILGSWKHSGICISENSEGKIIAQIDHQGFEMKLSQIPLV